MNNDKSSETIKLSNQHIVIVLNDLPGVGEAGRHKQMIADNLRRIVDFSTSLEVKSLTLISPSPIDERKSAGVEQLFDNPDLFHRQRPVWLNDEVWFHFHDVNDHAGQRSQTLSDKDERASGACRLHLTIIPQYDARGAIVDAVRHTMEEVASGQLAASDISSDKISAYLDPVELPEPDLIIITGGKQRLNNVLLWQCAYSELAFVEQPWRELTASLFEEVLREYAGRERRFGGLPGAKKKDRPARRKVFGILRF